MLTSLVILTLNNLSLTMRCLHSIRCYTDAPYELVVVDNGSTDGTVEWLCQQPDVRLIANGANRGFASGCNQGAAIAAGDHLLLLNNDTVVSHRWLSQLLAALHASGTPALVGPASNVVLKMQKVDASFGSEEQIHRFCHSFNRHNPAKWREVTALSGLCLLMLRSTWNLLGGFDESYGVGGFEDIDFSYRALKAGFSLRIAADTFIYHQGSPSFHANALDVNAIASVNRRLFLRKWGFNPERLFCSVDPAFLPGRYASPHPHHAPSAQDRPNGWYAMDSNGNVYRIEKHRKRPVVSIDTLRRLHVPQDRIARVSSSYLRQLPSGTPINAKLFPQGYPDVFLAQNPAGGMYIVAYGIRYAIENEAAFAAMGLRWGDAVSLSLPQLHSLHEGWPVRANVWEEHELLDYRVYIGPEGGLYYGEGQRLRAIPDESALHRYALRAVNAVTIPAEVFVKTPRGFGLP